ncbi:MAG: cellulase family glycosylhydrolase, partial [Armatimonadota bacterium]
YGNSLYESDQSVRTEEGRQAFARFAAAAAGRYRGRGIIWELWNEPNIGFWKPQPSVNDYMALAKVVFPAIRQADAGALCAAPATSGIPMDFLEECFRQGLLDLVDGVTVHPYRKQPPETAAEDYERLRELIARYCPDRPDMPILSGEWGYSSVWDDFDEKRQGQYLPRQFLTNLMSGVPLSIWYDWHDDGPDPKEPEHHFGTVTLDYQPKPAYRAMERLVKALTGMRFVKRLESAPEDYLLLFSDGKRYRIAAWTTGDAHDVEAIPGQKAYLHGDPFYIFVPADRILTKDMTIGPRSAAEDAIREAVFRYEMQRNSADAYFLATGQDEDHDPGDDLMQQFMRDEGVKPFSRCSLTDARFVDQATGKPGMILRARTITWISESEVTVEGGYSTGLNAGVGKTYRVIRKDTRWVVDGERTLWVS